MLAHAGISYLRACASVVGSREALGWNVHVELPLMHQAIELLLKAHAARVDSDFSPKAYGHRTLSIVRDYADRVPIFFHLVNDENATALLTGLEASWLSVRYAEAAVGYDGPDWQMAEEIAIRLADEYFRETGVRLLAHHSKPIGKNA